MKLGGGGGGAKLKDGELVCGNGRISLKGLRDWVSTCVHLSSVPYISVFVSVFELCLCVRRCAFARFRAKHMCGLVRAHTRQQIYRGGVI